MGEFSIFHWLTALPILFGIFLMVPWLAYRHGKRVGDQQGYIRGYKEGQSAKPERRFPQSGRVPSAA